VRGSNSITKAELLTEASQTYLARTPDGSTNDLPRTLPQLPSVEQGIRAALDGLKALAVAPLLGGTDRALDKVREGWRHHPEALFPVFAGVLLDNQQPRGGARDVRLLALQSEMYQRGAESSSILPNLRRLAR